MISCGNLGPTNGAIALTTTALEAGCLALEIFEPIRKRVRSGRLDESSALFYVGLADGPFLLRRTLCRANSAR